jgi:putative transposase
MVRRVKDVQLSYKTRIYPNPEQEEVLWALSDRCRLVYNFALQERQAEWDVNRRGISYNKQQNDLLYLKTKYYYYDQVYSKVLQTTLQKLDGAYSSFIALWKSGDELARPPNNRGKEYFFTMNYNQSGFKIKNGKIRFSQFYNEDVNLEFDITISTKLGKVKQVELFEDDNGKYYVSITHEVESPDHIDNEVYQAWDLGVTKQTAVNSDGKFLDIKNIRPDLYWKKPLAILQLRRDHCKKKDGRKKKCKTNSKNWSRFNNLKRKCEIKCSNQLKDFQHKMSKKIVNNTKANTIFVGDLDVKNMTKSKQANRSLNRSTQSTGYLARFTQFLTYKAEKIGKKVIKIDESYTSQVCCKCGAVHYMPINQRVYNCDCGNIMDRDRNSANDIMMLSLSQNALWTSYQKFSDGLLKTIQLEILPPEKVLSIFGNLRKTGLDIIPVYSQETPSARVG